MKVGNTRSEVCRLVDLEIRFTFEWLVEKKPVWTIGCLLKR